MSEAGSLSVNGEALAVPPDTTVAAAILRAGGSACRTSVSGAPRGPLCGMGTCFECRANIDGQPHARSCMEQCRSGMDIWTDGGGAGNRARSRLSSRPEAGQKPSGSLERLPHRAVDVVVAGAGPAGIAAACTAAECGRSVALIDDNRSPGGQIWRGGSPEARAWIERLQRSGAEIVQPAAVLGLVRPGVLLTEAGEIGYGKLILATGARELFLPFPGWTLPNVMGAGGLQAMVKGGLPIDGKRVVVAGSGPLLLAVAAYLRKRGANILAIIEQAPWIRVARFGLSKIVQAIGIRWELRGVPYLTGWWPVAAEGDARVSAVHITNGRSARRYDCHYVACGFGLVPNVELAVLAGCTMRDGSVKVSDWQQTSVPDVFCAGEPTGIGGLERSLIEGRIAGYSAAGMPQNARPWLHAHAVIEVLRRNLAQAFALRDELKRIATPDTIVCRCEDVTLAQIARHNSRRAAKLQTRCGMGACQGRVCGPAIDFLFGWERDSVRPPVFPTAMEKLAGS